jgi:hypothetical protein
MKTNRFLSFAAIFAIALTFFACSSEADPSPPSGGEPSSNLQVRHKLWQIAMNHQAAAPLHRLHQAVHRLLLPQGAKIRRDATIFASGIVDALRLTQHFQSHREVLVLLL